MVLNIVGMEISVPVLIWTVINFFILYFILKRFLFTPIMKFMDQRKAGIDAGFREAAEARAVLEESEKQLEKELNESRVEVTRAYDEARAAADKERAAVISQAAEQAAVTTKAIKNKIAEEEAAARADMSAHMADYVSALTNRLLGEEAASGDSDVVKNTISGEGA